MAEVAANRTRDFRPALTSLRRPPRRCQWQIGFRSGPLCRDGATVWVPIRAAAGSAWQTLAMDRNRGNVYDFAEPAGEYGNMAQIAVESAGQGDLLGLAKNFLGRGSGSVYAWSGVA